MGLRSRPSSRELVQCSESSRTSLSLQSNLEELAAPLTARPRTRRGGNEKGEKDDDDGTEREGTDERKEERENKERRKGGTDEDDTGR